MIQNYLRILHPEIPEFIQPYLKCPSLIRLKDIGLFCGMDYSCFFEPKCFYSRFDHSLGVALITYHFTNDKKATLAALFHDISTPVFSHVIDFKNKDYLKQESTESDNAQMIQADTMLVNQLVKDKIAIEDILHADQYPLADQKTPHICADRLEYMFSTGLFLTGSWTEETIRQTYQNLTHQHNGQCEELGFTDLNIARHFFESCLVNSKLYLAPYNKISMQLLAHLVDYSLNIGIIQPEDLYRLSESELLEHLEKQKNREIVRLLWLLRNQKELVISDQPLPNSFHACLNVKKRYIDPLVNGCRLSEIDNDVQKAIDDLFIEDHSFISLPYPEQIS